MSSFSISLGGMQSAQDRFDAAATRIAKQGPAVQSPAVQDSVDLAEARNSSASNATAIQIAGAMVKSAIDLVG